MAVSWTRRTFCLTEWKHSSRTTLNRTRSASSWRAGRATSAPYGRLWIGPPVFWTRILLNGYELLRQHNKTHVEPWNTRYSIQCIVQFCYDTGWNISSIVVKNCKGVKNDWEIPASVESIRDCDAGLQWRYGIRASFIDHHDPGVKSGSGRSTFQ